MNKKLGLVIVDGVGYRNFILSDFLNKASNNFDKIIIYSGLKKSVYNLSKYKNITVTELEIYRESRKAWFWRKLNETAHLYKHRSFFGMNDTLNFTKPKGTSKRSFVNRFIRLIASIFHSEENMKFYQKKVYKAFSKSEITQNFIKILKTDKPNVLFFTHQRPPYVAPLVYAANKNKIKTCSFIFSWDNLSSKGRIPAMFDSFLVWSDLMKKELHYFYPSVKENDIYVVGTPQFEPYILETYLINETKFFKKFNLDSSKKIICYSCADASIGLNDEIHIRAILKYIASNPSKKLQLLVRTSPAEDGKRFEKLKEEFYEIKWNFPKWFLSRENHVESWSQRIPTVEDVIDLKSILKFSTVNVNMLSTMSLDFMLFDKPVINTVFGNAQNGLYNDQKFLNYTHYKYVIDSKSVTIAKNEDELFTHLDEALEKPELRKEYRKELINLEIGKPLVETSKRIVQALKEF